MKISCFTLDDFLKNLDEGQVHRSVVHAGRVLSKEGISTSVVLQCSAIVTYPDETHALVECGVFCGTDVHASDGTNEGSERFDDLHSELVEYAEKRGYRVLPGIIDM